MSASLNPISFLAACLSGWLNQHQQLAIGYLTEDNRFFGNRSVTGEFASPMTNDVALQSVRRN
jgi:hypothetical protein